MRFITAFALLATSLATQAQADTQAGQTTSTSLGFSTSLIDALQTGHGSGTAGGGTASTTPSYTIVSTSIDLQTKTMMATLSDGRVLPLGSLKNLAPVTSVPEPGTALFMGLGLIALAWKVRSTR